MCRVVRSVKSVRGLIRELDQCGRDPFARSPVLYLTMRWAHRPTHLIDSFNRVEHDSAQARKETAHAD